MHSDLPGNDGTKYGTFSENTLHLRTCHAHRIDSLGPVIEITRFLQKLTGRGMRSLQTEEIHERVCKLLSNHAFAADWSHTSQRAVCSDQLCRFSYLCSQGLNHPLRERPNHRDLPGIFMCRGKALWSRAMLLIS